jgi:hypothetical protein
MPAFVAGIGGNYRLLQEGFCIPGNGNIFGLFSARTNEMSGLPAKVLTVRVAKARVEFFRGH